MNVPKLRFKEFTDEWIKIDLSTCFEYFSTNSLSREQLSDHGIIKNIHYGDIHKKYGNVVDVENDVATYIKDTEQINKYEFCCENDIIFADASEDYDGIGKAIELINVNEKLVSGLHTIHARDKKQFFSPLFKGYYFNTPIIHNQIRILANGFKVFGISKDNINNLKVMLPSKQEQDKIAKLLSLLDKKIELQAKKIEDLKLFKKGLNQKMLSKKGKLKKICEYVEEYTDKTVINNQYPILSSTFNGIVIQNEYFNKQAASVNNIGYKIIPKNYITYRSMSDTGKFHFNVQNKVDIGIVSPAYPVFKIKNINSNYFLNYINESRSFKIQIISIKEGGTRFALNFNKFKNLKIKIIDNVEAYGNLIGCVNRYIIIENNRLTNLNKFKKFLLQNMFV